MIDRTKEMVSHRMKQSRDFLNSFPIGRKPEEKQPQVVSALQTVIQEAEECKLALHALKAQSEALVTPNPDSSGETTWPRLQAALTKQLDITHQTDYLIIDHVTVPLADLLNDITCGISKAQAMKEEIAKNLVR